MLSFKVSQGAAAISTLEGLVCSQIDSLSLLREG